MFQSFRQTKDRVSFGSCQVLVRIDNFLIISLLTVERNIKENFLCKMVPGKLVEIRVIWKLKRCSFSYMLYYLWKITNLKLFLGLYFIWRAVIQHLPAGSSHPPLRTTVVCWHLLGLFSLVLNFDLAPLPSSFRWQHKSSIRPNNNEQKWLKIFHRRF